MAEPEGTNTVEAYLCCIYDTIQDSRERVHVTIPLGTERLYRLFYWAGQTKISLSLAGARPQPMGGVRVFGM